MPFSVEPKGASALVSSSTTEVTVTPRERAIAKLTQAPNAQENPVQNPTSVSPEELSAIKPPETPATPPEDRQTSTAEEAAPSEVAPEALKKAEEPLSSQYAVLARKEKALRAKVQAQDSAIQQREAALTAREAAIKAKEGEYQTSYIPKDRLAQDTWAVLAEQGITYDQVTQSALAQQQENPQVTAAMNQLKAEIKALKDAHEQSSKASAEQQTQAYQQAVAQIRTDTKSLVSSDPAYETIQATNSVDDVVELIERTFKEDKVLMTVEEACKAVEEYLIEEAIKIAKLKKIQSRLSQPVAPATPGKQVQTPPTKQPQQTLTNAHGTSRQLSAKERAILAFKGELK